MRGFRVYDTTNKKYVTDELCWVVTDDGKLFELDYSDLIGRPDCIKEDGTGLTDKDGLTEIFEGDILALWDSSWWCGYKNPIKRKRLSQVEFHSFAFGVREILLKEDKQITLYFNSFERLKNNLSDDERLEYEIVGNIHDNPELLEGNK